MRWAASAEAAHYISQIILERRSQPLGSFYGTNLRCTNRCLYTPYCYLSNCGSVSIDSFNGITPSGLRRSSGSSVLGTIFSLFHPHLPFGYIIEQKLNFCNIPDEIFTIYQATITEPLNCSVTNFLTSSD